MYEDVGVVKLQLALSNPSAFTETVQAIDNGVSTNGIHNIGIYTNVIMHSYVHTHTHTLTYICYINVYKDVNTFLIFIL